jgi:3'-phosphoadenosine 5'-phosphosulfate sulfotransferase (PAPS reductase)/FAD synthetase
MSDSFDTPEGYDTIKTSTLVKGGSWQCQEPGCGQITIKPYRWVVGAKTTFACDSCSGKVKEVGATESTLELEEVIRKMGLLEKQVMALHRRMDDQCGKP